MDGQELIQVNLRLPASALDSLSALAEQLRKLTAAVNGLRQPADTSEEIMESGFFDPERFQALRQKAESGNIQKTEAEARAVRSEVSELIGEPDRAGQGLAEEALRPEQEEPSLHDEVEQPGGSFPDTDRAAEWSTEDIAVVRLEVGNTPPDAPTVRAEPDSQIPEAEGDGRGRGKRRFHPPPYKQTCRQARRRPWAPAWWSPRSRSRLQAGGPI